MVVRRGISRDRPRPISFPSIGTLIDRITIFMVRLPFEEAIAAARTSESPAERSNSRGCHMSRVGLSGHALVRSEAFDQDAIGDRSRSGNVTLEEIDL